MLEGDEWAGLSFYGCTEHHSLHSAPQCTLTAAVSHAEPKQRPVVSPCGHRQQDLLGPFPELQARSIPFSILLRDPGSWHQ